MKTFLEKMIAQKETRAKELKETIRTAQTADEVRAAGDALNVIESEISEARAKLVEMEEPAQTNVVTRGAGVLGAYGLSHAQETRNTPVLDSMEYREAFAEYVRTGAVAKFAQFEERAEELLTTAEIGKIIPNTIMQEFIKELKVYGNLYNKVRKLNIKGGVEFPIEELIPTVKWITETTPSEGQKAPELKTSVSFGYHIAEARIAQSLLAQVVSLPVLEQEIARLLAEAFIKEFDNMILNGSGSGQPLGILNDTRVPEAQKIPFTAANMADWKAFRKNLFAKIPLAYRGQGVLLMTAATWESYIMTLSDGQDRPVYSETFNPATGETVCRFNGREVLLVEPDILKDFDTASGGEAWGVYLKPTNYAINSNLQIGFKRYFDEDKNKWVNKGLTICDGKLLDTNGVYILTKQG
jgi:HK97 family phage major capsid protein